MDTRDVFRSWRRFFAITTILGGVLALTIALSVAFALAVMMDWEDPQIFIGTIVGYALGFCAFACVSWLAFYRATLALLKRAGAEPPTRS